MAGYQTIEALRPILSSGPPPRAVVDRALVRPPTERERLIEQTIALRAERVSTYEIARRLKVGRSFVQWHTRHMVVPPEGWPDGGRTTRFSRSKAQRMKRAGFTYDEIGEDLGCSRSNAWRLIKQPKSKGKNSVKRPTHRFELIVQRATDIGIERLRKPANATRLVARGSGPQSKARAILFWIVRRHRPDLSLPVIGRHLNGFDHTSILAGCRRVERVVAALGLTLDERAGRAAAQLWQADWPSNLGRRRQ